jgi:putative transposase
MVNHKKVFWIYREEKLAVRDRGGRKWRTDDGANDRWSLDFVSDQLTRRLPFPHPDRRR